MSLAFQEEFFPAAWAEFRAMGEQHWHETEAYRHGQQFNLDTVRYHQCNSTGFYRLYTARSNGVLVGQAGMYVTPSMHTGKMIANEDCWFLAPDYRKGRNAIRFHQFVEAEMRKLGVVEIMQTVKLVNGAGRILEYLGYQHVANQYSKHLGDPNVLILAPAAA